MFVEINLKRVNNCGFVNNKFILQYNELLGNKIVYMHKLTGSLFLLFYNERGKLQMGCKSRC